MESKRFVPRPIYMSLTDNVSIAESAGSSLRHVIGMTPDLDHIWELATAKYERRQITATKLKDNVGRSHRALSSIINNALEELRSCKDYVSLSLYLSVRDNSNSCISGPCTLVSRGGNTNKLQRVAKRYRIRGRHRRHEDRVESGIDLHGNSAVGVLSTITLEGLHESEK
jgi:hypothetical protein